MENTEEEEEVKDSGGKQQVSLEERFYDCVFEDALLGALFEFHRELSITRSAGIVVENEECDVRQMPQGSSHGIFGNELPKNQRRAVECKCFVCDRMIAAVRFAPHLEKCIGIGRRARVSRRSHRGAKYAVDMKPYTRIATRSSAFTLVERQTYEGIIDTVEDGGEDEEEEETEEDDDAADGNWSRTMENGGTTERRNRLRSGKTGTANKDGEKPSRSTHSVRH